MSNGSSFGADPGIELALGVADIGVGVAEKKKARSWASAEAQIARDFASREASTARDWAKQMSDTAVYRRMRDLRASGLNPILALSSGSLGASNTPGAAAQASQANAPKSFASDIQGGLRGIPRNLDPGRAQRERELLNEQLRTARYRTEESYHAVSERGASAALLEDRALEARAHRKLLEEQRRETAVRRQLQALGLTRARSQETFDRTAWGDFTSKVHRALGGPPPVGMLVGGRGGRMKKTKKGGSAVPKRGPQSLPPQKRRWQKSGGTRPPNYQP